MDEVRNPDQWKGEGNCNYCRRAKYCGTRCKANERYVYRMVYAAAYKSLSDKTKEDDVQTAEAIAFDGTTNEGAGE